MSIHEDSMPFRFTPDGLDEATIDALINETFAQVPDASSFDVPVDTPARGPVRGRVSKRSPNGRAA